MGEVEGNGQPVREIEMRPLEMHFHNSHVVVKDVTFENGLRGKQMFVMHPTGIAAVMTWEDDAARNVAAMLTNEQIQIARPGDLPGI